MIDSTIRIHHHYFLRCNQRELGAIAAREIISRVASSLFDTSRIVHSSLQTEPQSIAVSKNDLPAFAQPRTESSLLPGGFTFVRSALPRDFASTTVMNTENKEKMSMSALRVVLHLPNFVVSFRCRLTTSGILLSFHRSVKSRSTAEPSVDSSVNTRPSPTLP